MNKPSTYTLLLDPKVEILGLQETALRCFYPHDVMTSRGSHEALEILKKRGAPEFIFTDVSCLEENQAAFYRYLEKENINVPFIVFCPTDLAQEMSSRYPYVTSVIEKPVTASAYTYLLKGLVPSAPKKISHVPVRISVLLRLGMGHFDLYLKLSDTNFVKVIHKGEPFFESDATKLQNKGVYELYIKAEDSKDFLGFLESDISLENINPLEDINRTIQDFETFEEIAKVLGWPPTVLLQAQKSVTQAVGILSKNTSILSTLKRRLSDPSSPYARHIGQLTYLVCAFSSSLGWIGEAGQVKLAMAALIHDAAVDESTYEKSREWNARAADPTDKSPETIRYRMHPYEASKIIHSLESFSSDVDQIILQHHESRDGKGFPRGLDATRIGHLSALFIMVEDLVEFIGSGENIETSVTDFIMWGRESYNSGHFKKIFKAIEEKVTI